MLKVQHFLLNLCFWVQGLMTDELRSFLELNLPKVKESKKPKFRLGIVDTKVGSHIHEVTKIPCESGDFVHELLRGVRLHFDRFLKDLKVGFFSLVSRFWFQVALFCCCAIYGLVLLLIDYLLPPLCSISYSLETWKKPNLVWDIVTAGQKLSSMLTVLTIW